MTRKMKCPNCGGKRLVKNGKSRHGNQRWKCQDCGKTFGEYDRRKVDAQIREVALEKYMSGQGLRATERLVGVSHNSIMEWVFASAREELTAKAKPDSLEWLTPSELKKNGEKDALHSSGILLILPHGFGDGKWAVLKPKDPVVWMRRLLKLLISA